MLAEYRLSPDSDDAVAKGCKCEPENEGIECPLCGWRAFGRLIGQPE
jgi:hypothetical protein